RIDGVCQLSGPIFITYSNTKIIGTATRQAIPAKVVTVAMRTGPIEKPRRVEIRAIPARVLRPSARSSSMSARENTLISSIPSAGLAAIGAQLIDVSPRKFLNLLITQRWNIFEHGH